MKKESSSQKLFVIEIKDTLTSKDRAIWILVILMLLVLVVN